jgi:hypothetical protein
VEIAKLLQAKTQRRDGFIANRGRQAQEWDAFFEAIGKIKPEDLNGLEIPETRTHETIFPSLYKERIVEADYQAEIQRILPFLEKVRVWHEELLQRAAKELGVVQ